MPFNMNQFMQPPPQTQETDEQLEEKYKDQLKKLEDMGFPNKSANL